MTDDGAMHRQLMRMHGFSLMYMVLTELADDNEIVLLVSDEISTWISTAKHFIGSWEYEQVEASDP